MKKEIIFGIILLTISVLFVFGCKRVSTISEEEINAEAEILALEEGIGIIEARNLVGQAQKFGTGPYAENKIKWLRCNETDDGIDYPGFGQIEVTYLYMGEEDTKTFSDICKSGRLKEYYCNGDGFSYVRYTCPKGCSGGACRLEDIKVGKIYAETKPSGATFCVDGSYKGTTPETADDIEVGNRRVDLKKTGYEDYTTYVDIHEGGTASIETTLKESGSEKAGEKYPLHEDTTSTIFWIGEIASEENAFIGNQQSAWDDNWELHYGGFDDPNNRKGHYPTGFTPNENPFYVALPYDDFENGERKQGVYDLIYWAGEKEWSDWESMCKNRWVKIVRGDKVAYGQWQDVGPFEEDDAAYVFGTSPPHNRINDGAGIDVSPAIRDYLGLSDMDEVNWQFVDAGDVQDGPWKQIVTSSHVYWE